LYLIQVRFGRTWARFASTMMTYFVCNATYEVNAVER